MTSSSVLKRTEEETRVFGSFETEAILKKQLMKTSFGFLALSAFLLVTVQAGETNKIAVRSPVVRIDPLGRLIPMSVPLMPKFAQVTEASATPKTEGKAGVSTSEQKTFGNTGANVVKEVKPQEFSFELKRMDTDALAERRAIIGWKLIRKKK